MGDENQTAPQTLSAMAARVEVCVAQSRTAATYAVKAYEESKQWRSNMRRTNLAMLAAFVSLLFSLAAYAR